MEFAILREPLDSLNILTLAGNRQCQARAYEPAVYDYAASAANADAATFFGPSEADFIPQDLQQQPVRFQLQVIFFTVDEQSNLFFHEFGAYLVLLRDSTYEAEDA
jgi:hypothetical protein